MLNFFNQLISLTILSFWALLSPFFPVRLPKITVPINQLVTTPSATPTTVTVSVPAKPTNYIQTTQPVPWGTTEKIGDHLYRVYVANDPAMGTSAEILQALNNYRRAHNAGFVFSDPAICQLALRRAQEQDRMSNLDEHKGLIGYMNDQSHWSYLNITAIGENASYGYIMSGVHLIEWVFDSDVEHRSNQLNPNWTLACAGTSGVTVDIIFGKR